MQNITTGKSPCRYNRILYLGELEGDYTLTGGELEGDFTLTGVELEGDFTLTGGELEGDFTLTGGELEGDFILTGGELEEDFTLTGRELEEDFILIGTVLCNCLTDGVFIMGWSEITDGHQEAVFSMDITYQFASNSKGSHLG
jgi:hypothetical protein